jgi:hypothetical protein
MNYFKKKTAQPVEAENEYMQAGSGGSSSYSQEIHHPGEGADSNQREFTRKTTNRTKVKKTIKTIVVYNEINLRLTKMETEPRLSKKSFRIYLTRSLSINGWKNLKGIIMVMLRKSKVDKTITRIL